MKKYTKVAINHPFQYIQSWPQELIIKIQKIEKESSAISSKLYSLKTPAAPIKEHSKI